MPRNFRLTPGSGSGAIDSFGYLITVSGGVYSAQNGTTGIVDYSGTNFDTVLASVKTALGTSNPAVIELGPGTFTTTTGIDFAQSNLSFIGQGMGVTTVSGANTSALDSDAIFQIDPAQSSTGYDLTANATAGDLTITISAANLVSSGIVANDYIIMYSSLSIDSEFSSRNQGELHKVLSVDTGTGVITLGTSNDGGNVYQTMTTANSAKVAKLVMYKNINIEGITFTDAATSRPDTHPGVCLFSFVDNLKVTNCEVRDGFHTALRHRQCMNVKVSGCYIKNMNDVTPSANVFYGVSAGGATINMSVQNCTFENMRHAFVQGAGGTTHLAGSTRNVSVSGCTSINSSTAHFDAHQACEGLSFVNNTMIGDDGGANGIGVRSPATITGNTILGALGRGISLFGGAHGSVVSGNFIKGCTSGVYVDKGVNKVNIIGNTLKDGTDGIIFGRSTDTVTISNASPAVITDTAHAFTAGTQVRFTTTGTLPTGISLATTYYIISTGLATNSFQISATEGGAAINTSSAGSGTHTMSWWSGNDTLVADNQIVGNSSNGMEADGATNVKLSGNFFKANARPLVITNTDSTVDNWMITDNYSVSHTASDRPTLLGTDHFILNNVGFEADAIPRSATKIVDPDGLFGYSDIQSAIDALPSGGGKVFVRAGTYTITSSITFASNHVVLEGEGNSTIISYSGTTVGTAMKMADTTQRVGIQIKNMQLLQTGTNGVGTAIDASNFAICRFEDLWISGGPLIGIDFNDPGTLYNHVTNCRIQFGGTNGVGVYLRNVSNENTLTRLRVQPGTGTGMTGVVVDAHANSLYDVDVETGSNVTAIDVQDDGHDCTIVGMYSEGNGVGLQLASGVESTTIIGGIIIDSTSNNLVDNGAVGLNILGLRLQYEPYTTLNIYDGRLLKDQGADVASANNLSLGTDGNTFEITGTTQINLISNTGWRNGSMVVLLFTSTPTVKHNQATSGSNVTIQLAGAVDFVASAGDTLTLLLSEIGGTQAWRELARAVI